MRPLPLFAFLAGALLLSAAPLCAFPGDLDRSFQGVGWTHVPFGSEDMDAGVGGAAMAVQSDGRVVIAGNYRLLNWGEVTAVFRFLPDGSPDSSFGDGGWVNGGAADIGFTNAVALQNDGKIVTAGGTRGRVDVPFRGYLLHRYLPDGRLDTGFGGQGTGSIVIPFNGSPFAGAQAMVLQNDGGILVTGVPGSVVRCLPDGTLDPSFGVNGKAAGIPAAFALALQNDGKILLGGHPLVPPPGTNVTSMTIMRLLPDGSPDASFGTGGSTAILFSNSRHYLESLAVQSDGKIAAAGTHSEDSSTTSFGVARLLPDGTPDPGFNGNGRSSCHFGLHTSLDRPSIVLQSGGRLLVASSQGAQRAIVMARFLDNGTLDSGFGPGGKKITPIGGVGLSCAAAILLPGEKLLVTGGYKRNDTEPTHVLLARYRTTVDSRLVVEHPAGTLLPPDGSAAVDFGVVTLGTTIREFTVRNTGAAPLTGLSILVVLPPGGPEGEFFVFQPLVSSLAPGGGTTFFVNFRSGAAPGPRTASLHIASNDPDFNPFVIPLTGSKITQLQHWRTTWFGSPDNSGPGADGNDFDHDGLPNFMEYATLSNPHTPSPSPLHPVPNGGAAAAFTYTRPSAALAEFSYQPESASSPEGPWSADGLTSTVLTDDDAAQAVQVTPAPPAGAPPPRLFVRLRVTNR